MFTLTNAAREYIDFAADFVIALPGLTAELAPVAIPSLVVGILAGAWIRHAWQIRSDRRDAAAWQRFEEQQRRTVQL